jgi:hypothetical protein
VDPLVVSFTPIALNINNPEGTTGGNDPEDLSSIKANAPQVFKSRGVNVTIEDYEARAGSFVDPVFGAIAVAKAVTVRGSSDDAFLASKLSDINAASADLKPVVDAAADSIIASSASIATSVADAQSDDDDMALILTAIGVAEDDASVANDSIRASEGLIQTISTSINGDIASVQTAIDAFPIGADAITAGTKASIDLLLAQLTSQTNEVNTQSSSGLADIQSITDALTEVDSKTTDAEAKEAEIRVSIDQIETDNTSIDATAEQLKLDVDDIADTVAQLTQDVSDHVDSFLSNECKSNLIEVPVLTLDSEGFYVVPTIGLQQSLQRFLDKKKEVTQVIKVVGASDLLVLADVTTLVGVLTGFNEATVRSQVEAAILSVLRQRPFGKTLRLSELYAPIAPEPGRIEIDGVDFVNISIVGPPSSIDVDGNLPVSEFEVVTRGVIAVTSTVVESSS